MTSKSSPITPPPELVRQWTEAARYKKGMPYPEGYEQCEQRLCAAAAQWGADQELEACIELLRENGWHTAVRDLRAARRPKPPSLKEQALEALGHLMEDIKIRMPPATAVGSRYSVQRSNALQKLDTSFENIRRALEALGDD